MKLQKKLISLLAAGLLVFGVAACEGGTSDDDTGTTDTTTEDTGTDTGTDITPTDAATPTEEASE